jgi:hypothetical protein
MCRLILLGVIGVIGCAESPRPPEQPAKRAAVPEKTEGEGTPLPTRMANDTSRVSQKPRIEDDPVAALLEVPQNDLSPGATFFVTVVLEIGPFYEIHDLHAPPPLIPTQLNLELPKGFQAKGDWSAPKPVRSESPDGHSVYVGKAKFTREIRIPNDAEPGESDVTCTIRYQACNMRHCLAPKEFKLSQAVSVRP